MSYHNHQTFTNGYPQQYPGPEHNGYIDPRQPSQGAVNGYAPYGTNGYQTNGNYAPGPPQPAPRGFQNIPPVQYQSPTVQQQYIPSPTPQPQPYQQQYPQLAQQQQRHSPQRNRQSQQSSQPSPSKPRGFGPAIPTPPPPPLQQAPNGYVHMSEIQAPVVPRPPPIDYQSLLLSLADEYFVAAFEIGAVVDTVENHSKRQEYYQLIATGLGCLDALLKRCKLAPEKEAKVRLRYAYILYEETENTMEAEEALSKGISVCDRYKYFDLKYNMQHLLARVTFTKNAKAAFKFLEQVIADANAYQHTAWEYAFRFLKVSMHLELSSSHDLSAAHAQLRIITSLASNHGDKAILAMATMIEAILYLKEPGESGGFEQAQRALASVRSLQLDEAIANIPQLTALISFVDSSCNLQRFYPEPAFTSMQNMQSTLSHLDKDKDDSDGTMALPMSKGVAPPSSADSGIVRQNADGAFSLMFNWMPNNEIYNVGYLLSGIAMSHKNTTDGHKSEQMFDECLQRQQGAQNKSDKIPKSIILFVKQQYWRERMSYYAHLYYAFTLISRTCYTDASNQIAKVKELHSTWPYIPNDLFRMTQYLKATIAQGTGDLVNAFSVFESIADDICSSGEYASESQLQTFLRNAAQLDRELYILSTMNLLQILRNPNHPNHAEFDALLAQIAPLCTTTTSNRGITAAYHIINAAAPESSKILATKQALSWGSQNAQAVNNNKLVCMILNILSWKFFSGILVDQTEKSVQACLTVAKRCADTLWISVSAGVMADSLEAAGRLDEAAQVRAEGMRCARELPPRIQEEMGANALS